MVAASANAALDKKAGYLSSNLCVLHLSFSFPYIHYVTLSRQASYITGSRNNFTTLISRTAERITFFPRNWVKYHFTHIHKEKVFSGACKVRAFHLQQSKPLLKNDDFYKYNIHRLLLFRKRTRSAYSNENSVSIRNTCIQPHNFSHNWKVTKKNSFFPSHINVL
jgi:hypothetical protein